MIHTHNEDTDSKKNSINNNNNGGKVACVEMCQLHKTELNK